LAVVLQLSIEKQPASVAYATFFATDRLIGSRDFRYAHDLHNRPPPESRQVNRPFCRIHAAAIPFAAR
jgi:hypothetical protein